VQIAVVGNRQRIHPQRLHLIEQVGDAVRAVEERVLAMRVEMNERHGSAAEMPYFRRSCNGCCLRSRSHHGLLQRFARAGGSRFRGSARDTVTRVPAIRRVFGGGIGQRSRLRLPRIVGYLVVGFLAGSGWLGLIRSDEVQALSPIRDWSAVAHRVGCRLRARRPLPSHCAGNAASRCCE